MGHLCKKCLLLEAGEKAAYQTVNDYLSTLDDKLKAEKSLYEYRLSICRECEFLISGMCLKCGCYVEIRAALKDKKCPDYNNRKW